MGYCGFCQKENVDQRCSLCHTAYYCDASCQKKHWSTHKLYCKGFTPPRSINDFEIQALIGTGNFSEIYHAIERRTDKHFAIKKVNKQRVERLHKTADVMMEKHALNRLKDLDSVIHLYECFKDESDLYYLMDYISCGELWSLCKGIGMSERLTKFYLRQVVDSMIVLHERGIIHRDLKTENILITEDGRIKLIDFGTAKDEQHPEVEVPGNSMRKKKFENFVGTPHFMAPECINNRFSNAKSDVWSLGNMVYYMLAGQPCFQGGSDYLIFNKSLMLEYTTPDFFSQEARDFITSTLQLNADARPTMQELSTHPFLSSSPRIFPIDSLFEISLKSFASYYSTCFSLETYNDDVISLFQTLISRLGRSDSRLDHIKQRILAIYSRKETSNSQGV